MRYSDVPGLRGLGITFIMTGLMAIGFMAFAGIQLLSKAAHSATQKVRSRSHGCWSNYRGGRIVCIGHSRACCDPLFQVEIGKLGSCHHRDRGDPHKALKTQAGATLLDTLSNDLAIPSRACGQGCGVCKVNVHDGGERATHREGHISRGEERGGCRLACQVKVKADMEIELEADVFSIQKWGVRSIHNVATFIKEFVLELPEGERSIRAGGYIQIESPAHPNEYKDFDIEKEYHEDWDKFNIWQFVSDVKEPVTRAYSMANYPAEEFGIIMLNVRVATPPPDRSAPRDGPPAYLGTSRDHVFVHLLL